MGIGIGINFTVIGLGLAWRARLRGVLLLDAGPLEAPILSRNVVAYVPLAAVFVYLWLQSTRAGPYPLVMMTAACAGILVMVVVTKRRVHLRFTDQGVCYLGLIRWSEIRSYRWRKNPEGAEQLEIYASRRGRYATVTFPIPAIYREGIAEILTAHLPRGS